jgi:ADP-ribose pyrophosphatase YjhB (NUDIX family)
MTAIAATKRAIKRIAYQPIGCPFRSGPRNRLDRRSRQASWLLQRAERRYHRPMPWRLTLQPIIRPIYQVVSRLTRGATLGVRGLVLNEKGEVLLVEHTYVAGWYLPGGGVEHGETVEDAVVRELREEAGVRVLGRPALLAVHANHRVFRGDHVLVFRVERWEPCEAAHQGEIRAVGWFAPDALPDGISAGTRRRIAEALHGAETSPHW